MNNSRPSTKILLTLIVSFISAYLVIGFVVSQVDERDRLIHKEAAKIIQHEITERFDLILDVTLVIGQMSSPYFYKEGRINRNFEEVVDTILKEKEYILGINQLNSQGQITAVYPKEDNQKALGKVSQNYNDLLESYQRGEKYWFSPPFHLFQGGAGFVFYLPITENGKLVGWIAPVISSQLFFEHFRSMDFLNDYYVVIKDAQTGNTYFETALPSEVKTEEVVSNLRGREIVFQTWPKVSTPKLELSYAWRFFICFVFSLICGLVMKNYLQKKKAYSRLENISDLLKLTSNEALTKLMDIQTEYLSLGSTGFLSTSVVEKDVQSVTNLIEQIELLQNIAVSEQMDEEEFEILPLLEEQVEVLRDIIRKKNIHIKLDVESFRGVTISGNKWLVSNTILKNALSYSALVSCPSSQIEITHNLTPRESCTTFHIDKVYDEEVYKAFKVERRLLVARNVIDLLNGTITVTEDGADGMFLKLTMPPRST